MFIGKTPAFELSKMDKPESLDEKIVFRTRAIAERVQRRCGGVIKETFVHVQKESN